MAEFGVKYWAELRSRYKGVLWHVEIAERGFTGTAEEMAFDGGTPLQITWEKRGDEFYVPVKVGGNHQHSLPRKLPLPLALHLRPAAVPGLHPPQRATLLAGLRHCRPLLRGLCSTSLYRLG